MVMIVPYLILANGIYDIACALNVLWMPECMNPDIHAQMFEPEHHSPMLSRLLAYWVLTYGTVRVAAGLSQAIMPLAALTYFIEAYCFEHEHRAGHTLIPWKSRLVSVASLFIGIALASYAPLAP